MTKANKKSKILNVTSSDHVTSEITVNEMFHDQSDNELMSQAEYDAMIDNEPDVTDQELSSEAMFKEEVEEGKDLHQDLVVLPDIASIDLGSMKTKSARIRYLRALGYTRSAVAEHLGIRYQHVFNVEKMEPKRAAREDFPEMVILRTDVVSGDQGLDNPTTLTDLGLVG